MITLLQRLFSAASLALALSGCASFEADILAYKAAQRANSEQGGTAGEQSAIELTIRAIEVEPNDDERGALYSTLAGRLLAANRTAEANAAYEQAAILGNLAGGQAIARAQLSDGYALTQPAIVARNAYVGLATDRNSITASIALAELLMGGTISSSEFGEADGWLRKAAALGSTRAVRLLAESAESRGDVESAADFYVALGDDRLDRALRQARAHFRGTDNADGDEKGQPDLEIAQAWLTYASSIDGAAAGQTARSLYRETEGRVLRSFLIGTAVAGGYTDPSIMRHRGPSNAEIVAAYGAATTDAERTEITDPLHQAAQDGDAASALLLARIYRENPDGTNGALLAYLRAYELGETSGLAQLRTLAAVVDVSSPAALRIVNAAIKNAENGHLGSATMLSELYAIGGIVQPDVEQSLRWMKVAADGGDPKAQFDYGTALLNRDGHTREEALSYLDRSAEGGNAAARALLRAL